jgi:hypothetical protein
MNQEFAERIVSFRKENEARARLYSMLMPMGIHLTISKSEQSSVRISSFESHASSHPQSPIAFACKLHFTEIHSHSLYLFRIPRRYVYTSVAHLLIASSRRRSGLHRVWTPHQLTAFASSCFTSCMPFLVLPFESNSQLKCVTMSSLSCS